MKNILLKGAASFVLVGALASCASRASVGPGDPVSSAPDSMELSAAQQVVATNVAFQEAAGSSPDDPGVMQPIERGKWPSYVTGVQAIANLTRAEAGKYTDSSSTDNSKVIVVRMTGQFAILTSRPPAIPDCGKTESSEVTATPPAVCDSSTTSANQVTGTAIDVVADEMTGQVLDFSIGSDDEVPPLPAADVLYAGPAS